MCKKFRSSPCSQQHIVPQMPFTTTKLQYQMLYSWEKNCRMMSCKSELVLHSLNVHPFLLLKVRLLSQSSFNGNGEDPYLNKWICCYHIQPGPVKSLQLIVLLHHHCISFQLDRTAGLKNHQPNTEAESFIYNVSILLRLVVQFNFSAILKTNICPFMHIFKYFEYAQYLFEYAKYHAYFEFIVKMNK